MNALEDRLVEYLNSLEPAVPAPNLRRVDKMDIRFAQVGLSPYLNPRGATMQPVQPPENPVPMRVRICSHVTQAKFLHVEDSLALSKLRLFAGTYRKGEGANSHCHHFISVEDARVVFHALAVAEPNFTYKEYKGTVQPDGKVVSRVLSVTSKGDQVYIELKTGPGTKTPTGAVTPNGKAEVEVNVAFKTYEARRLGQTVLAYIQAWDILRLMAHRNLLGKLAAFELVPTTSRNGTNNQRAQLPQTTATGAIARGTPSPHRPANGKQLPVRKPNAAASPPITKPAPTNGAGVAQAVKGQPPATVAAAKTPPSQATKPVIREQHPVQTKTQATNAAATTPTVKPTQVNKAGVNPSRQEQKTVLSAAAEQPSPLLAENTLEEPQSAVKGEEESANAAAIIVTEVTSQSVSEGQQPDRAMVTLANAAAIPLTEVMAQSVSAGQLSARETMKLADAAATAQTSTASGPGTPQSVRPAANSQPPIRPLTRRGPAPRPMLVKPQAGASATPMPKQPIAAATTSNWAPSSQSPETHGRGMPRTVPPAAALAMAEAVYGATDQPLRYLNGTLVDLANQAEVQAFLRYQQEKQQAPPSRPRLRAYAQQQQIV